jgi:hypothetical protein
MCDLTPEEASFLAERASLAEVVAAQARCPRTQSSARGKPTDGDTHCTLLEQLNAAKD